MPLEQFLYVSRARDALDESDIDAILAVSRARNLQAGLTGKLLFTGAHFAQVLEGPADALDPVLASIAGDARHSAMRTLMRVSLDTRRFPQWTMAYVRSLGAADLLEQLMASAVSTDRARRIIDAVFVNAD